jgi:hypothetical protein
MSPEYERELIIELTRIADALERLEQNTRR